MMAVMLRVAFSSLSNSRVCGRSLQISVRGSVSAWALSLRSIEITSVWPPGTKTMCLRLVLFSNVK